MKRFSVCLVILLVLGAASAYGAGESEGGSSADRGAYLASRGIVIPPSDVLPESYVAQIDYGYPDPSPEALGVSAFTGNRQVGIDATQEWLHIGLRGRQTPFEELPPLNLVFVIDSSGSMYESDKIEWVKEALGVFLSRVRDNDYVAVVVCNDESDVVFRSARMNRQSARSRFARVIGQIEAGGGTDIIAGLTDGYAQAQVHFQEGYTNRVLIVSDGLTPSEGVLELVERHQAMGISCSTIGVGASFNTELMVEIARSGGGSSRFISDREEMERIFSTELDRMVAAAATNVTVQVDLLNGTTLAGTWGYAHEVQGPRVTYRLPTLHNGDYETLLARLALPLSKRPGEMGLARVRIRYVDLDGRTVSIGPELLSLDVVPDTSPVYTPSNPMVLRSSTMLRVAESLIEIGSLYYSAIPMGTLTAGAESADGPVAREFSEAFELTVTTRKSVQNARRILGDDVFEDQITVLDQYLEILGESTRLEALALAEIKDDYDLAAPVPGRSFAENIDYMLGEVLLSLPARRTRLALAGFVCSGDDSVAITDVLDDIALDAVSDVSTASVVSKSTVDAALARHGSSRSALMDTGVAIEVGRDVRADHVLTGTVLEMSDSVIVFVRVIDVESGAILTVSQVVLEKDREVRSML